MKILIYDFGTYTYQDVIDGLNKLGIEHKSVSYYFRDKNEDDFFYDRFTQLLKNDTYDAVFSVNYFPMVAVCCHDVGISYISWSYDNPLNVIDIEKTLGFDTNRVYLFDKAQVEGYRVLGFDNVYHMPLAVNTERLDKIVLSANEHKKYDAEVSFVGKLYDSDFEAFRALSSEYQKGFIDGVIDAQQKLYGAYLLDEMVTDELADSINEYILSEHQDTSFRLNKEALRYAMGANITRRDRLVILGILSRHHEVKLYTRENNEFLKNAIFCGSCGYRVEMPKIFKASKINLNITLKCIQTGIPLRCMDVLGAGGFLLSAYQPELDEYFINGEELAMYESVEDAIAKTDFYLKHEELRAAIARAGYEKVKKHFTYEEQLKKILL